jgi:putative DNA primase/helicase
VQLPVKFDPVARCPAWDKFISEVFPGDSEAIAWEISAWLMTPDTSIQKAILLMGDGANGKSTYLRAVLAFIGKHNAAAVSLHKLEACLRHGENVSPFAFLSFGLHAPSRS